MDIMTIYHRLDAKRWKLVSQTDIPDMAYYSRQWTALAEGYRIIGFPASETVCISNATRYGAMAGSWRRVDNAPFVELVFAGG